MRPAATRAAGTLVDWYLAWLGTIPHRRGPRIEQASPYRMHTPQPPLQSGACHTCCNCNFHLHLHPITKSRGGRHGANGLRDCTATLRSLIQHLVLLSLLVVAPGSNRVCSSYPDQLGISIFGAPSDNRLFPFGVDTLRGRSLGTGHPVWHLVLRVSISLPPLATQCLYGKYHGQKKKPAPDRRKSFLMISLAAWPSG